MMNNEIKPGQNGLPPVKAQYEENEKIKIAEAAKVYGLKPVAEAYGVKWQAVAAWRKKNSKKNLTKIIIQSPSGQEITSKEIMAKIEAVGSVDVAYIRTDENAIYWVRGNENGAIAIW